VAQALAAANRAGLKVDWNAACANDLAGRDIVDVVNTGVTPKARVRARVTPFLLFQDGRAEEAMNFYVRAFPDARIVSIERHAAGGTDAAGAVRLGIFELLGQRIMCADGAVRHEFDFTPSMSLFVESTSEAEMKSLPDRLSPEGKFLTPPGDYGFWKRFAWLQDRHGVTWQVNLAHP